MTLLKTPSREQEQRQEQDSRQRELEGAVEDARAHLQALEAELRHARAQYRACAQQGDGDGAVAAWRTAEEIPHRVLIGRIALMQAEDARLGPQVAAAEQAEHQAAADFDREVQRLPYRRLLPDSPRADVERIGAAEHRYHAARQQAGGLKMRQKENRRELDALLLKAHIDPV